MIGFFSLSIIFCLGVSFIERLFEIGVYYHPDVEYYLRIRDATNIMNLFQNPKGFVGQIYIIITSLFKYNINYLIGLNILIYSITNAYLFQFVKNTYKKNGWVFYFAVLIVIFDPYRAHLAVHILKDTLIIFSLVILFFSRSYIIKIIASILGVFLRFSFFIYMPVMISNLKITIKNFILASIIFFIVIYPFKHIIFAVIASGGQSADMSFRTFDTVPNFHDLEFFGNVIRSIIWPVIRLTGIAFFFSPVYLLFLLQSLALGYIFYVNKKFIKLIYFKSILFIIPLIALGYSVSGYNSYLRYSQPIMTLFSIFLIYYPFKNKIN